MRRSLVNFFSFAFVSFLLTSPQLQAHEPYTDQQIEVALRMIGHQVLLATGDSVSRILPVKKEHGRYTVQFDTEFVFNGEELVNIVNKVLLEAEMGGSYFISVEECVTGDVVYSYQIGNFARPSIIPCATREQPVACYNLVFTPLNTQKSTPASPVARKKLLAPDSSKDNTFYVAAFAVLIALGLGGFLVVRKKKPQAQADPNVIALGAYQYDKRNTELIWKQERIKLTGKEADLLILLYDSANTTVKREVILEKVWGDEGNYVGRTLDVFISKLRKKLQADPGVKIVNIRGVGYKLVVDV